MKRHILVTWIAHHDLLRLIRATTHPFLLANGCALIYVTFIPFPAAVLADHLGGPETSTAVAFYCGTFVFGSAAFNLLVATIARALNVAVRVHLLRIRYQLAPPVPM